MLRLNQLKFAGLMFGALFLATGSLSAHCNSGHCHDNSNSSSEHHHSHHPRPPRPPVVQQACATEVTNLIRTNQEYRFLFETLRPNVANLTTLLGNVSDQATYNPLYLAAVAIASSIPNGRVLITLPDGTVVVDTSKSAAVNTYANFQAKAINENHNSRISILDAQLWPCGRGAETKLSTSTGQREIYVALRLGQYLNSQGTARISQQLLQ